MENVTNHCISVTVAGESYKSTGFQNRTPMNQLRGFRY